MAPVPDWLNGTTTWPLPDALGWHYTDCWRCKGNVMHFHFLDANGRERKLNPTPNIGQFYTDLRERLGHDDPRLVGSSQVKRAVFSYTPTPIGLLGQLDEHPPGGQSDTPPAIDHKGAGGNADGGGG
jgi:hypothetical protein